MGITSSTYLLQPAPARPMVDSPSIGTKVLAVNSNFSYGALPPKLGNGTYSVLDVATNDARAFSGLGAAAVPYNGYHDATDYPQSAVAAGGKFLVHHCAGAIRVIDPSSPGFITVGASFGGGSYYWKNMIGVGDYVAILSADWGGTSAAYHVPTWTPQPAPAFWGYGNFGAVACPDGETFVAKHGGSGAARFWHIPSGTSPGDVIGPWAAVRRGCVHLGYLWTVSGNSYFRTNPVTRVSSAYTTTVPGGTTVSDLVVGPDGRLHSVGVGESPFFPAGSPILISFDPGTSMVEKALITPDLGSSAYRSSIASAGGKLVVPGGFSPN